MRSPLTLLASPRLTVVFFVLAAAGSLATAHELHDATVLMALPFALLGLNLGAAVFAHARFRADAPLLLWAVPEAPTGERLRLNSLCGINLGGHALNLRGRKYSYAYAPPDDTAVLDKIRTLALAGRARRLLQSAHIGLVGDGRVPFCPRS